MQREREGLNGAGGVSEALRRAAQKRKNAPKILILDIGAALAAFLFVRAPLFFGAHPFAAAFLAALPSRVWVALFGTLAGAMTLGESGIIYAMTSMIIVFLRVIVSGAGRRGAEVRIFGESILLRMSVSVIGGFIAAVYELLLSGMKMGAVLFGLTMIIAPPLLALSYSALFGGVSDPFLVFTSDTAANRLKLYGRVGAVRISILIFVFALAFCMRDYSALGISLGYLFASAAALVFARRFGAVFGGAVGFAAAFALSGTYSGAFMLAGITAGALCGLGVVYSALFGGVALSVFAAYVGGVVGVTSVLPEYAASAALVFPLISRIKPLAEQASEADADRCAIDMVGTMALAYKSSSRAVSRSLSTVMSSVSGALSAFLASAPSKEELRVLVFGAIKQHLPYAENDGNVNKIATKLYKKEGITRNDLAYLGISDNEIFAIFTDIKVMYDALVLSFSPPSLELRLFGKIINEAQSREGLEFAMNEQLTDRLETALAEGGFSDFTARVFGDRQRHLILAGRDEDGSVITSAELRSVIEKTLEGALGTPEYFRRGNMALMECSITRKYSVSYASVGSVAEGSDVSGDVSRKIQTPDDMFYALVSDGMGTGEIARKCSELVSSFLASVLSVTTPTESVMHLLNSYLAGGREECSATVDLFSLDLYNKEAVFLKSGGAPSYVKRGGSIFRIRSQTAPLGLMQTIDTERIRVQVEVGDYVIMTSDGVAGSPEDAPWLLELISSAQPDSVSDFASAILASAKRHRGSCDDITVTVMKIEEAS